MARPPILACDLHDYVEVMCLYRYDVVATGCDGTRTRGRARNVFASNGAEYLTLDVAGASVNLALHELARIDVLTPGAKFDSIELNPDQ